MIATSIHRLDFAILAAQTNEFEAVLRTVQRLGSATSLRAASEDSSFVRLPIQQHPFGRSHLEGVIERIPGTGRVEGAIGASRVLTRIQPRYIFLLGLAGGFSANGVELGDVLVATKIMDFETQKLARSGNEIRWRTFPANQRALQAARITSTLPWWSTLPNETLKTRKPTVHFGPVLSGDKVFASAEAVAPFLEAERELLGVEMEGGGVAAAVNRNAPDVGFLMIRGVVDLANDLKSSDAILWLEYASEAAATFTVSMVTLGSKPLAEE